MSNQLVKNDPFSIGTFPTLSNFFPNLEAWSVGFDREWSILEKMQNALMGGTTSYPPYNIKKTGEDRYEIEMAVAGFSKNELKIELHNNELTIEGAKMERQERDNADYVYRGIAGRQFRQCFALADHVKVKESELRDGILKINLELELPEEKKPRSIEIK
jgi:molecular chaperone IbpA